MAAPVYVDPDWVGQSDVDCVPDTETDGLDAIDWDPTSDTGIAALMDRHPNRKFVHIRCAQWAQHTPRPGGSHKRTGSKRVPIHVARSYDIHDIKEHVCESCMRRNEHALNKAARRAEEHSDDADEEDEEAEYGEGRFQDDEDAGDR